MNKFYNTQQIISSNIKDFLLKVDPHFRKTQLNIIPFIIIGMILSESSTSSDIAKNLKDDFSLVQHDSVVRRIKRLFTNKYFNPYKFYDKIIRHVIYNYKKKHNDKRVHIIFDHMFSRDNYTVFMFSMRIGKQGIPLWFRCFDSNNSKNAFKTDLIIEGISYIFDLFNNKFDLIFLADRWFNHIDILKHIDSLNHTYCIRFKNSNKVYIYDNRHKYKIWKTLEKIKPCETISKLIYNTEITNLKYSVNIAISKSKSVKEHWIIITNGDPKRAIKDYGYRFGGIETLFKNQKSNGFYIENTKKASLKYFESMYTLTCFATLFLTIIGTDYSKNTKKIYKNEKLVTHKKFKDGTKKRVMSLFKIGLTLFHRAYNSTKYIRIPFKFILYDT